MKALRFSAFRRAAFGGLALSFLLCAGPSAAAIGDWVAGDHARVRLVAAGVDAAGNLSAGIEIAIDPGWHTYWRSPGDAGMAPLIDFAGSLNVGEPVVSYPAPRRLDDGYAVSNIYTDAVLLPFAAVADNPSRVIDLVLKLDLGVCAEVCVPEHFEARLSVPAIETDLQANKLIAAARQALPGASQPGVFAVDGAARTGGTDKRPVFEIRARVPDASSAMVFVEGPGDWYGAAPKLVSADSGLAVYRIEFDRLTSKTPIAGSSLRITIVSGSRAIEETVSLD